MTGPTGPAHDLTKINARCGKGEHGRCVGRIYTFPEGESVARITDCLCGCGCSRRVPVTRPGAARTRTRQLAERRARAEARKPQAVPDAVE